MPVISWPVIVTRAIVARVGLRHELAERDADGRACWNFVEKFQISTPTTTSTIQNNRLFNVEFKQSLPKP